MQDRFSHTFEIKKVFNTHSAEYLEALKIYNATTPAEIKTPTNQISFWLNAQDETEPFQSYAFVLYSNGEVVGLALNIYIKEARIIMDEYLAVKNEYRHPKLLLMYEDLIRHFYQENGIDIDYYINEISNKNNGKSIDKESAISREMLCVDEFGKIAAQYYTLPIGVNNHESSFEAFLYIKSADHINVLSRKTFFNIVHSIYFDYWIPWYQPLLNNDEMNSFRETVTTIYKKIQKATKEESINIQYSSCSNRYYEEKRTTDLVPLSINNKRGLRLFKKLSLLIVVSIIVFFLLSYVFKLLGYAFPDIGAGIGAIVSAIITILFSGTFIEKS